ncbi:MAG: hypothetical protein JWN03_7978 [Nocardia sp.]|uniref:hypothetical protein n=1 Tax=Nocardia sp. TaxID=1821 RepID=UPI0026350451|nr:hypothetical protein [Nocardia sp.]MCU1647703.1 hypothetical protein [Nocardia sp.]
MRKIAVTLMAAAVITLTSGAIAHADAVPVDGANHPAAAGPLCPLVAPITGSIINAIMPFAGGHGGTLFGVIALLPFAIAQGEACGY